MNSRISDAVISWFSGGIAIHSSGFPDSTALNASIATGTQSASNGGYSITNRWFSSCLRVSVFTSEMNKR